MGLLHFKTQLQQYFDDNSVTATVQIGQREPTKQINQGPGRANRVCLVPIGGTYSSARNPGRNPRPLRTLNATADVHCWGYDGYAANIEESQYEATWQLHDWVIRALHTNNFGTYDLSSPRWTNTPTEKMFGKELVFTLEIEVPILDVEVTTTDVLVIDGYSYLVDYEGNILT